MKIYSIESGYFKLDGGAMFGVVPKSIWNKLLPADSNNMIPLAMRCLLIEDGKRLILIDNGIGDKQSEKFFSYYFLHGEASLKKSLNALDFAAEDITDMVLTHLHFDHCGGSVEWNNDRTTFKTAFPNATYWIGEQQWQAAMQPNAREKASFLKENIEPIHQSGQLKLIQPDEHIHPDMSFVISNGHTTGMLHPVINYKDYKIMYMADMMPTQAHLPTPYVMGYDVRPLDTMNEKNAVLADAASNEKMILFFEHDPNHEACNVVATDKGYQIGQQIKLSEL